MIELHYRCNLRCRTCNIWKPEFQEKRGRGAASPDPDWQAIQKSLARSGVGRVTYLGGEPLLAKGIFRLIENASNLGLSAVLVTNGSLLAPDSIKILMDSGVHTVVFSLDGPNDVHDSIRGESGTFKKVLQAIRVIQREKKLNGMRKPRVSLYMTVSSLNFNAIPSILDIARQADVNSLRFQLISVLTRELCDQVRKVFKRDVVGLHSYAVDPDLKPGVPELKAIREMLNQAGRWSEEVGIGLQIENILQSPEIRRGCEFTTGSFVVNPHGEVVPCPMLPGYSIGNILETDLEDLWGNDAHARFLSILRERGSLAVCGECCVEKT